MKKSILLVLVLLFFIACAPVPQSQSVREQEIQNSGPSTYHVKNFVERENINKRQELFDNAAQVSWIYCLADNGQVIFYGPVLGKVTSSGKRLEPTTTIGPNGEYTSYVNRFGDVYTTELAQQDGTFGSSDQYVYWFDPDGNYYQWGGNYFLTSIPIAVNESVLNIRNVQP